MDQDLFKDRILETENLTDELEDTDASWLLDWGIARLDWVLQGVEDVETAGSRVNALMAVMRKINRIVGSYADKSPQRLAEDLAGLHNLFTTVFHPSGSPDDASDDGEASQPSPQPPAGDPAALPARSLPDFTAVADYLSQLSPTEALHYLAQDFYPLP